MAEEDKRSEDRKNDMNRRRFCQVTGAAACSVAAGGAGMLSAEFLRPRVLFEPPTHFDAGPPDAFDQGQVLTSERFRAYVIRRDDGFCALSAVCTHLGCVTRYRPDDRIIACPCHGSRFSLEGEVLAGPAPRSLPWLELKLNSRGRLIVDTAIEIAAGSVFKP